MGVRAIPLPTPKLTARAWKSKTEFSSTRNLAAPEQMIAKHNKIPKEQSVGTGLAAPGADILGGCSSGGATAFSSAAPAAAASAGAQQTNDRVYRIGLRTKTKTMQEKTVGKGGAKVKNI